MKLKSLSLNLILIIFICVSQIACNGQAVLQEQFPVDHQLGGTEVGNPPKPSLNLRTIRGFLEKKSNECISDQIIFINQENQNQKISVNKNENCKFEFQLEVNSKYQIEFEKNNQILGKLYFNNLDNLITDQFKVTSKNTDIDLGLIYIEDHKFTSQFNPLAQNDEDQDGISDFEDEDFNFIEVLAQEIKPAVIVEIIPQVELQNEEEDEEAQPQAEEARPVQNPDEAQPAPEEEPDQVEPENINPDRDHDGVSDDDDNCPLISNPNQEDRNQNGAGDICEDQFFTSTYTSCLLNAAGELRCWGKNNVGQLGQEHNQNIGDDPNEMGNQLLPIRLGDNQRVKQVSAGTNNTCVLLESNQVKCWGEAAHGILGDEGQLINDLRESLGDDPNEMGNNILPINLGTNERILKVKVDSRIACVLFESGRMKCWGNDDMLKALTGNQSRSVGDEPGEMGENLPYINLGQDLTVRDFAMEFGRTCALLNNHRVKCWGFGTNVIGDDIPYMSAEIIPDEISHMTLKTNYIFFKLNNGSLKVMHLFDGSVFSYEGDFIREFDLKGIFADNVGYGLVLTQDGLKEIIVTNRDDEDPSILIEDLSFNLGTDLDVIDLSEDGHGHMCMMFLDQSVKCIYENGQGQLGLGHANFISNPEIANSPFLNL